MRWHDVDVLPTPSVPVLPAPLRAAVRPLFRTVTYSRWLHLLVASVLGILCGFFRSGTFAPGGRPWLWIAVLPLPLVLLAALVPVVRRFEGIQARLLLFPGPHAAHGTHDADGTYDAGGGSHEVHGQAAGGRRGTGRSGAHAISTTPSATWADRCRTAVWLLLRLEAGVALTALTIQLPALTAVFVGAGTGHPVQLRSLPAIASPQWWYLLLAPLPMALLFAVAVVAGRGMAAAAPRLLGPSAAERLAALETRTERLLEHNRLAQELHDSIGHALTVAVVQAGAARAAGSPEFTDRALAAIEETGRQALDDLERALRLLRQDTTRSADRPTLADAARLLESARAAGSTVSAELHGALEEVPGPVSREGYRMVQEALTNVLRHAGPVAVSVRIAASRDELELDIRNPLPAPVPADAAGAVPGGRGRGLRGIRERAALLGGVAETGPRDGEWRVHARLPLHLAS
ncbi:sensor histidine kinase [Streptomyces olivaceiscleroticus]|uniref:histidine kinase n=1 Tax=Streptomyces olivaceiscleroticus TaxID=68245 RepID=A0ABN1A107_9ACTN